MDRTEEEVTYLDTHVVIWLYQGDPTKLSLTAAEHIRSSDLFISPAVLLEIQFLHEIRRITATGTRMLAALSEEIGLRVCQHTFSDVIAKALPQDWARDPFDRLIVAQASVRDAPLITKDQKIRRHYKQAVW